MASVYLTNAFSLNMLHGNAIVKVTDISYWLPVKIGEMISMESHKSIVGHEDIARVMSSELGIPVPVNRGSISLHVGDVLYVGQYSGPRLPEGCKVLPPGAKIKWLLVEIRKSDVEF